MRNFLSNAESARRTSMPGRENETTSAPEETISKRSGLQEPTRWNNDRVESSHSLDSGTASEQSFAVYTRDLQEKIKSHDISAGDLADRMVEFRILIDARVKEMLLQHS